MGPESYIIASVEDALEEGPDPLVGTVLSGRYRIESALDEGSFAVIYRATDLEKGAPVAVKALRAVWADTAEQSARFEREARALASLTHPNIVGLIDYGVDRGTAYLVLELLPGRTLREELAKGALPPREAFSVAHQVLAAVAHAHRAGILHRDLKPANVFLQADTNGTRVKILDFGLAKLAGRATGPRLTHFGQTVGTPAYVAPEQLSSKREADERSDVYAVGLMLFEMLAGRKIFEGELPLQIRARMTEDPPRLSDAAPALGAAEPVDELLGRALARDPERRYQSADEFLAALEAVETSAF
jgi:serine/threonine-protein kinase